MKPQSEAEKVEAVNPVDEPVPGVSARRPDAERQESASLRRIKWIAVGSYAVFAAAALILSGVRSFFGLTCSALVVMIAFLWLEEFVQRAARPIPNASAWKSGVGVLARYVLFGTALGVIINVARFNALSVLLGSSIVVVGILGEALVLTWQALTGDRSARTGESDGTRKFDTL